MAREICNVPNYGEDQDDIRLTTGSTDGVGSQLSSFCLFIFLNTLKFYTVSLGKEREWLTVTRMILDCQKSEDCSFISISIFRDHGV